MIYLLLFIVIVPSRYSYLDTSYMNQYMFQYVTVIHMLKIRNIGPHNLCSIRISRIHVEK